MYAMVLIRIPIFTFLFVADNNAFLHRDHTLSKGIYNFSVVSNYKNCRTSLVDLVQKFHDLKRSFWVQITGRLVSQ